ncbi:MAG TPA: uroporphyrinogen-III C-methyltransferase [Candidatus Accumulibacter phosphatis]|nr:MAG: putative uroporphyrinogen-III C-methyltransferase [Candidatus Accumulibacter sp. SK-11]HRL75572.1 uroporphyrinogen-III C-methyltransferase [Candidatus Accumulibacter phosphatis]HRQ93795.1 uroporphyrinogen-III C-methyltransferase [Candidatus Accumulibacter phosphatis]
MNEALDSATPQQPASPGHAASSWRNPWVLLVALAFGLAAWQWLETRLKLAETQQELARRLVEGEAVMVESRALARQSQEQLSALLVRLGALEAKIGESQSQQAMLEELYQGLARGRDEWVLAEIEQGVTLAAQQLQLAGNVQGAVLALQTADARLAGSSRPQFISLRKVLVRDLDRLRAVPQVDMVGMNLRLESVINAVDGLPLAVEARPRLNEATASAVPAADAVANSPLGLEFWRRLGSDFWDEVKGLIRIQRFDRDEPALLAPGQAFFLRENLKLRLLNARLALLAREQWTFRNELKHAQAWLDRYFDSREPSLHTVQGALKQLASTDISIEVPTLNESLAAIKTFKLGKEQPR